MKVTRTSEVVGTEREVRCPRGGFVSLRLLLARDGMGFSLHETRIPKGAPQRWHYKNHLEACYCVSGRGELVNVGTGERYAIEPGTLYALDAHDAHTFEAFEDTVLISVFNPPVTGNEVHGTDGSYELADVCALGLGPH